LRWGCYTARKEKYQGQADAFDYVIRFLTDYLDGDTYLKIKRLESIRLRGGDGGNCEEGFGATGDRPLHRKTATLAGRRF
jgi:hypothetical protein